MKKYILKLLFLVIFLPVVVHAKDDAFFVNQNGVAFSQDEYDYVLKIFDSDFANIMTREMYDELINENTINSKVKIVESNNIMPLSSELTTQNLKMKLTSSCVSNGCNITFLTEWLKIPTIISYDVMGVYLKNTSILNTPNTVLYENGKTRTINDTVTQSNGYGASFKFNSTSNNKIYQYFRVEKKGEIFASYQRAMQNISLSDSKKYTISIDGYGQVFLFNESIRGKYTNYPGFTLTI